LAKFPKRTFLESVSIVDSVDRTKIAVKDLSETITITDKNTYYFDISDGGATDADAVWTDPDSDVFDGSTLTYSQGATAGSTSSNFLFGAGTSAPTSGNTITQVRARIYAYNAGTTTSAAIYTDGLGELLGTPTNNNSTGGGSWDSYATLSTPAGGWTWQKVNDLEVKVYTSGNFSNVYKVEIEVVALGGSVIKKVNKAQKETITTTDALAKKTSRGLSETIAIVETFAKSKIAIRGFLETITLTDIFARAVTYARTLTETITLTDTFTKMATFVKSLTETITIAETFAKLQTHIRTFTETITIHDKIRRYLNGLLVSIWSKIEKQTTTFTKSAKPTTTFTKVVKSLTDIWTKSEKPEA